MLQFRDSRDGSIELTGSHPSGLAQLLAGRPTRLSSLVRDPELLADARRRARSIRQKAEQLASERGISAAHLAIGFATWNREENGSRIENVAPVMLRHVTLVPRGSRVEDFEIVLDNDITINPALVAYLKRTHDVDIDVDEWVDATGAQSGFDPAPVFERLRSLAKGVSGLLVNQRLVVSTFADIGAVYAAETLPEKHPVLRALAGDPTARRSFGAVQEDTVPIDGIDELAAPEESTGSASSPADARTDAGTTETAGSGDGGEAGDHTTGATGEGATGATGADGPTGEGANSAANEVVTPGPDDGPSIGEASAGVPSERSTDDADGDASESDGAASSTGTAGTGISDSTGTTNTTGGNGRRASADDAATATAVDDELDAATPADGDHDAVRAPRELPRPLPDRRPHEEYLAIDVDGDQQAVVDAAVSGDSIVVDTPPGTGATQVAVAVATTLAHTGRSVLYVGQTAAALDDFAARMEKAGLPDFVVDGRQSRSDLHAQLIGLISSAERAQRPDLGDLLAKLNEQRSVLSEHTESLHRVRMPWGVSVYSTMQHLARLTAEQPGPSTPVRFGSALLEASDEHRAGLRDRLVDLSALGAFTLDVEDTVWFGARFASDADAEAARQVAERVAGRLPEFVELTEPVLRQAGFNPERTVDAWGRCLSVLLGVRRTLDRFSPDVFDHGLTDLIAATGSADYRRREQIEMGLLERNRLKKAAREFLRPGAVVDDMHAALIDARAQRAALREIVGHDVRPQVPRGLLEADELRQEIEADFATLGPVLADTPDGGDLGAMRVEEARARLEALGADRESLADLPARTRADAELREAGLGDLLDDLRARRVPHELVDEEFDLAYWATVLQQLATEDPQIGGHDGVSLHRTAADYRICDKKYVAAGADRLRYSHAQGWKSAIGDNAAQAQAIRDGLRARHLDVRGLSDSAPDVLTALAPVWMMSPLQVPSAFVDAPMFDTVIIADAGRASVAELLPAIARAKQVIALGDERLLGPRSFSVAVDRRSARDGEEESSVLSELAEFLPVHRLHTTYRQSPAGLIDLSNRHFYQSMISAIPTALTNEGSGVEFSFVPDALGSPDAATGQVESLDAEVQRVVDLVLKHARTRARQSLAVVTLTPWHAQRVASAIQKAIRDYPYVASFFTDKSKEPFVVTDCERIQGTVRDAVILSLGYGRTRHGRIVYSFGPLSKPGGERFLAAAITRARRKLTLVSCFEADDFDTSRLRHGAVVLPGLLADAAAGGRAVLPAGEGERDPLISDIAERLLRRGVTPRERYADIDLAVAVSTDPEQGMALAVETDGPGYARVESIRERERLRPEALARRGWRFMRVWSTDAFVDPQTEADRIFEIWKGTVEDRSPQALLDAARAAAVVVGRQGNRPKLTPGLPLHKYSDADIDAMVDWIQSDDVTRSDAELRDQLRSALAQKSRARRVDAGLDAAVARYRARYAQAKIQAAGTAGDAGAAGAEASAGSASTAGAEASAGNASVPESRDTGIFLPESRPEIGQEEVMPLYNTGKLREQDLLDSGLRESELDSGRTSDPGDGTDAAGDAGSTGGTDGATGAGGATSAGGRDEGADRPAGSERSGGDDSADSPGRDGAERPGDSAGPNDSARSDDSDGRG